MPTSPSEAVVDLYERHARAWAKRRGAKLHEKAWLDRWLAGVPGRSRVLDIGCGSGQPIAAHVIDRGFDLTGVDSSRSLVEICRARLPNARWIVADMRRLALDERFAALIAWDSIFHLTRDDQREMFSVFAAHAAPGARLLFTTGPHDGVEIGEFEGEPLHHASLSPDEYRRLLDAHGFALDAHLAEDPECGHHTVWLASAKQP